MKLVVYIILGLQEGHPYEDVIRALAEDPKPSFAQRYGDSMMPPGMDGPCVWVQTRSQLEALVEVLKEEKEIGVDIEHHHVHSFRGFTSLVQVQSMIGFTFLLHKIIAKCWACTFSTVALKTNNVTTSNGNSHAAPGLCNFRIIWQILQLKNHLSFVPRLQLQNHDDSHIELSRRWKGIVFCMFCVETNSL